MLKLFLKNNISSSADQISIREVKDGILKLEGNFYRKVITTTAINFELKSEEEQDSITDTFESLLNGLNFPIQIIVRTRELDIDDYLDQKKELQDRENIDIYKRQIEGYREFIKKLVEDNKIISRNFYIVVGTHSNEKDIEIIKSQLDIHLDILTKHLARLGITSRQLNSLEIIELFYSFYNPRASKFQPLLNLNDEGIL